MRAALKIFLLQGKPVIMLKRLRWANLSWLILTAVVVVLDQWTKWLTISKLALGETVHISAFLNLTHVYNTGAAFSFLSQEGGWQCFFFAVLAIIASIGLLCWLLFAEDRWQQMGLGLILGGALGNFWDRINYCHVIDFIDLHYQSWHWPVFNIADSAIVIGALIVGSFLFLTANN